MSQTIPIVDYLRIDGDRAWLVANQCQNCSALYFDRRNACARCGQVEFAQAELSTQGRLRTYTIVTRGAPGVPTPFVSAVVDLEGGGVVKSTLVGVNPDPEAIQIGMSVALTTFVAGTDGAGNEAVTFGFTPIKEAANHA
ncbi:MAG: Zn-ribbon domain-containing OB-fold protein [Acidimicrobiales bacterium]